MNETRALPSNHGQSFVSFTTNCYLYFMRFPNNQVPLKCFPTSQITTVKPCWRLELLQCGHWLQTSFSSQRTNQVKLIFQYQYRQTKTERYIYVCIHMRRHCIKQLMVNECKLWREREFSVIFLSSFILFVFFFTCLRHLAPLTSQNS